MNELIEISAIHVACVSFIHLSYSQSQTHATEKYINPAGSLTSIGLSHMKCRLTFLFTRVRIKNLQIDTR